MTPEEILSFVSAHVPARRALTASRVQSLWGGYGEILKIQLEGAKWPSAVVKRVEPPRAPTSPEERRSHERKLRSYAVEETFYREHASESLTARVPLLLASERLPSGFLLVLEDLDAAGFSARRHSPRPDELDACLTWLAEFHAHFLGREPRGLWPRGSYWHLATRPDELALIEDPALRRLAPELDRALGNARFRTLVHGDAKIQNFCFGPREVAAVDFQYVGGGVGVQDLIYFLDSCLPPAACARQLERHLDFYFAALRRALLAAGRDADAPLVEAEWRDLVEIAWVDFYRFLVGWAPGTSPADDYGGQLVERAHARLAQLARG